MSKVTNKQAQQASSQLKKIMGDSEWQSFIDSARQSLVGGDPLDQFEWVILRALKTGQQFELNKPYDLEQKGKGFKSGKIQLIRDTRDSKIFVSSFHVDRQDGSNKLTNVTLYQYERKRNQQTGSLDWNFDCKLLVDNSSQRGYPVNTLFDYLKKQLSLDGHKLDSKYARFIEGKSESDLIIQTDLLKKVKNLQDSKKLNDIISAVINNENIVLNFETYQQLIQARYNQQSITDYENDLQIFRKLIDNNKSTETDLQSFLGNKEKDRSWFFGLDYVKTYPKFNPGLPCEYDFLIRRFNLVFDIVELKGPNSKITEIVKISNRKKPDSRKDYGFTSTFGRALHQVIDYLQKYEQYFDLIEKENPSVINFNGGRFPHGTIVMSKRKILNDNEDLHKLNRQFSSVEILTYDDLYDRAENIIKFIKKTKTIT